MKRCALALVIAIAAMGADTPPNDPQQQPASRPTEEMPTSRPASTEPIVPIVKQATPEESKHGEIALSDGRIARGEVFLRGSRQIKIFDKEKERYRYVPLKAIRRIDIDIIKEVKEDEWRWLEAANDVKVRTGRFYWWHQYDTTLTLTKGKPITGAVRGPIYIRTDKEVERFILHDRNKGELNADLAELVFVKWIDLEAGRKSTSRPASSPSSRPAELEIDAIVSPDGPEEALESPD